MKYLLFCLFLVGCDYTEKCKLVQATGLFPAVCKELSCNGAGCIARECSNSVEKGSNYTMLLNGNSIYIDVDCKEKP